MASLDVNIRQANADFQSVKNNIIECGVEVIEGTPTAEYGGKVKEVFEKGYAKSDEDIKNINADIEKMMYGTDTGGKSFYDEFWDSFQLNGTRVNYPYLFAGTGWTDKIYNPKYEIIVNSLAINLFCQNSQITSTKVAITIDSDNTMNTNVFFGCTRLVTIVSLKVTEKVPNYNNWFNGCNNLTDLNITEDSVIAANGFNVQWSTKLSHDSLMSIINALKDNSGTDTWKTITLGADNIAKLSAEELNIMTTKQWEYS